MPPAVRHIDAVTNMTTGASSSLAVAWTQATLAGSRLYLAVATGDNSLTVTATPSDPSFTLVSPPGKVTRQASGLDKISVRLFQIKNAGVHGVGTGVTVSFTTGGSAVAIKAQVYLIEVTGVDATAEADQVITGTGSATFVTVGPYSAPTTVDSEINIALVANGNNSQLADPGDGTLNGFTINSQPAVGGGDAAGVNSAILTKVVSATGNQSAVVNVTGGFARNFAYLMVAIPASAPVSSFFGLDDTNDGKVHRGVSLQYYGAGIAADGTLTQTQVAQKLASMVDILVANVNMNIDGTAGTDRYHKMTAIMQAVKPNIGLYVYCKTAQISEGSTIYPNTYYAHQSPWPSGAKITAAGFPGVLIAQPSVVAGQATYNDPRGWAATSFKEQRARLSWWQVDQYNAHLGGKLNGIMGDSMYKTSFRGTQVDPATNLVYTIQAWVPLVWTIGDEMKSRGSGRIVWANGLQGGVPYYGAAPASKDMLSHCDGGLAESWIRSNYSSVTAFPSEADWKKSMDMIGDANASNKGVWVIVNIANNTAGSPPNTWKNPTAAQLEVQRRFSICSYMFAKRSRAWFEFVQSAGNGPAADVQPWNEDHPYYHLDLGAPLDNWANAAAGKSAGLYIRKFTRGVVVINSTSSAATFTYDRTYNDPGYGQPGPGVNDFSGVNGTTLVMQPAQALILTTGPAGPPNNNAPTGSFISPETATSESPALVVVSASDADGDAIAGVNLSYLDIDGVTVKTVPMTPVAGNWQWQIPLLDGVNTLTAVITDDNTSPLSSTITTDITFTPPPAGSGLPQDLSSYDVLIGGLGLLLYRDEDDTNPSRVYKTEPMDSTFSPIFIDRANVQGDLGDNTQDFYMTFVQRDWSGGMGQKYFRQQDTRESSFWDCKGVDVSSAPGSVRLGAKQLANQVPGSQTAWVNGDYFKHPGVTATSSPPLEGLLRVDNTGTSAKASYKYSKNGGNTWFTLTTTSATTWNDNVDLVIADNKTLLCLESGSGSTSTIHSIGLPGTATTLAWDNTTEILGGGGCHLITYYNGSAYVADKFSQLKKVTLGTSAAQSVVHDFGGGRIVDIITCPSGIYILYGGLRGDYRIYLYDGTNTSEIARLPSGWHYQTPHATNMDALGNAASANSSHVMAFADGVLYVGGLIASRDYVQSQRHTTAYRQALWFLAPSGGSSGLIWATEVPKNDWRRASGGALTTIRGDAVVWIDGTNGRLMKYDPATGSVSAIAPFQNLSPTILNADQVVSGDLLAGATTLTYTSASTSALVPGTVLGSPNSTELALVVERVSATQVTIIRGYQDTTPVDATFTNGTALVVSPPLPAPHRLAYDPSTDRIMIIWYPSAPSGWAASGALVGNRLGFYDLSYGPAFGTNDAGMIATSAFDFNSSLTKHFRSVAIDGVFTQFPDRNDETPGSFDIYYVLDGVASTTADATLVVENAVPGQFYDINAKGRSASILVQLNPGAASPAQPISQGPVLTRISVKGVPFMPGYRTRMYQVALFKDMPTKSGASEPNTPAQLYAELEALIQANAPITVADKTMPLGTTMVFIPEDCVMREIRADEWVAYLKLREV